MRCEPEHAGKVVFATFTLHVWSPAPRRFTGTLLIGFFGHMDPHKFETKVDLSSSGDEIHHSVTERVTSQPGGYTVRVQLQETGADLAAPRPHEFVVPVYVK